MGLPMFLLKKIPTKQSAPAADSRMVNTNNKSLVWLLKILLAK